MYEEYIEKLEPKPAFNLKWYSGSDDYSDGDVEDQIINIIANNEPEEYRQAIFANFNWPVYYHLTHVRKNILNWYPFKKDSSVLEIGCGLGAITGTLCQKCGKVTAVELSKRRATAAYLRCREYENLEIIVGNLNDIEFKEKYDYITLIGVLEYQGKYTDTGNPYADFLRKIRGLLKPDGVLLIAIENQFGLKYWCGAKEDHTGIPFDGINHYLLSNSTGVRTFSKEGLRELVHTVGFENTFFYYPMPDYKLPVSIFSEEYLPDKSSMRKITPYYTPDADTVVAQEHLVYDDVIKNRAFEFFANSFLVECSNSRKSDVVYATIQSDRFSEYRLGTVLTAKKAFKFASDKKADIHLRELITNEEYLEKHGVNVLESEINGAYAEAPFIEDPILQDVMVGCLLHGDFDTFYELVDSVWEDILKSSEKADREKNILYSFNPDIPINKERYGEILSFGSIDMTFSNALCVSEGLKWFDQEWRLENVPASFIMYRALSIFYDTYPEADEIVPFDEMKHKYGIFECEQEYEMMELLFQNTVVDLEYQKYAREFYLNNGDKLVRNIRGLMR